MRLLCSALYAQCSYMQCSVILCNTHWIIVLYTIHGSYSRRIFCLVALHLRQHQPLTSPTALDMMIALLCHAHREYGSYTRFSRVIARAEPQHPSVFLIVCVCRHRTARSEPIGYPCCHPVRSCPL